MMSAKVVAVRADGVGVYVENLGIFVPGKFDFTVGDDVTLDCAGKLGKADFKVLGIKKAKA